MQRENEESKEQILTLEEENKRLLDTLVRHSKSKATNGITTGGDNLRSVSTSQNSTALGMSQRVNVP